MIETEIPMLDQALEQALSIAKVEGKPKLISITEKMHPIDPFIFFDRGAKWKGKRIFWSSSQESFFLVGVGEAISIDSDDNEFLETEKQWKSLLKKASIYNAFQVPGTGPIVFGGGSFDPEKGSTGLWETFKTSQFRIPSFLLTIANGESYVTFNAMVASEKDTQVIKQDMLLAKQYLTTKQEGLPDGPRIVRKEEINPEQWKELIVQATDEIKNGQADKIVLAREMRVDFTENAYISSILQQLHESQSNSFIFAFENEKDCFLGATPERLVRLHDSQLLSTCLAGTAPRGMTKEEDKKIGDDLLADEKNREEHDFVVQMIRNAVEVCCEDVQVPSEPVLYPLRNLQHLYTPVQAILKEEYSILDVVQRLHPTPALGGVPREKSMTFIREHERLDRGWYGAPIGWMDSYQNGEFAVAIRSALIQGKSASLFAGCGVVKDSDPEAEYQETNIKFTPMLSVLGG
ncbi:isochorismate synthase [Radiobacillus kanasensis]|uniref:isochorismate synthase n=1 Tax=Radiobacillus kanasensis TaxID=2844358 RepID=UPI001E6469BA|nr:isochorismate synthase [Radiobacillus kanasensis]UFT98183.1 isochorismate synthase [Radiobacillus kanasensis]